MHRGIIIPGLLKSGVKIYEHGTSLLHAKTAVVDEVWSTVGSTNMDFLSLLNNDEVNAVILNHEFAVEMEKMFVQGPCKFQTDSMGRVERKTVVAQSQGVVCKFIYPVVVTFRRRSVYQNNNEGCESEAL